jgi:hypothetical protein
MDRFGRRDLLEVAIAARVVVRPGNPDRLHIVTHVSQFVEPAVLALKEVCAADASEVVHRRSNVLMVSVYQQTATASVEAIYAFAVQGRQTISIVAGE